MARPVRKAAAPGRKMKLSLRVSVLLAAGMCALAATTLMAQAPPLYTKWVNYTPANGFPEGEAYSVAIDGNQVWAGTANGLVLIENGKVKKVKCQ